MPKVPIMPEAQPSSYVTPITSMTSIMMNRGLLVIGHIQDGVPTSQSI